MAGRKKRKKRIDPGFDDGMLKWAEERIRKWRECTAQIASKCHRERNFSEGKRGNSKFDRGREHYESGLKPWNSANGHSLCSFGLRLRALMDAVAGPPPNDL